MDTYNISAQLNQLQHSSRRKFLKSLGSGLALGLVLPNLSLGNVFEEVPARYPAGKLDDKQIGAWLHISETGQVTIYTGKTEVGQNIRTSLSQMVAEELPVAIENIKLVMADTDLVPYDFGTVGSRSIPAMGAQLRKAAANAREILLDLAAREWNTDKGLLQLQDGYAIHRQSNKKLSFANLTKGQQFVQTISGDTPLIAPEKWKVLGTSVSKVNGRDFITGRHQYVSDLKVPGMLYAKIIRPQAYGATLASLDISAAKAMLGVTVVHEGNFIGVLAPNLPKAREAAKAIKVTWNSTPQPSRTGIFEYLKKNGSDGQNNGRNNGTDKGEIKTGLAAADKTLKDSYQVDYIAHVPLEPRAALANWENGKLTVYTGTQRPFGVQNDLAKALNLTPDKVRVIVPDTGSGYGGKHSGEAALEAAKLAVAVQKPVKLVWSREEEFTWAYFRPAGLIEVSSGAKNDGTITAWEFHNYNSGPSGIRTPYEVDHQQIQYHPVNSPLKQGSYRGLASTANIFVIESHMDDLARLVGKDPLAFRLHNLKETRLRAVLEAAAKGFNWGKNKPMANRGFGIACGTEKGGFTATFAEIEVNPNTSQVKVIRTTTAFECGAVINPKHLDQQILGAIVQGLGGALFEAIDFENGKILNPKLSKYRVPRFKDVPIIEIIQVNRPDLPSAGAGEAPIVAIAPAIRNAIADASGLKLKTLPLAPNGLNLKTKI